MRRRQTHIQLLTVIRVGHWPVKEHKVVGVRGRITDRVNRGRLGPKGLHG